MSLSSLHARYLQAFPDDPDIHQFVHYAFHTISDGSYLEVAHIEGCDDVTDDHGFTYDDLAFVCDQHPDTVAQLVDTYIYP